MRVLVTGATGYLGRQLVPALRERGCEVVGIGSHDVDLRRQDALDNISGHFDQVWHLAAWTQAGDFCLHHPGEQWVINQQINTNVLAWWQARHPKAKLIAMGTSCSYAPGLRLIESSYLEGEPVQELYAYAMSKRMLLVGLQALTAQFGLRYLYLVPSTLFGPGYHATGRQLHFIFDIIAKVARAAASGVPVVLWGDGHQRRELVFTADFVRSAIALADSVDNEVVNVGAGEEHSIRWYAQRVSEVLGFDPEGIEYDTNRYVGVRSKCLDIEKMRRLLPGLRQTPLVEALRDTTLWFVENVRREGVGA